MIIRNLTDSIQKLSVREILGEHRQYEVYVQPKGCTELIGLEVVDKSKLGKIFTTEVGTVPASVTTAPTEEVTKVENTEVTEDTKDVEVEEPEKVETPKSSAHICDICGSEFASARALTSHKNKAHAGE